MKLPVTDIFGFFSLSRLVNLSYKEFRSCIFYGGGRIGYMENNKFESLQAIKFKETLKKVENLIQEKTGKFVGFANGTGNQPLTSLVVFDLIENIKPATTAEIANFILDRISEGHSLQRISDPDDQDKKSLSPYESSDLQTHNVREVVTLVRDNQLLDTGDYSNAAIPGELYIGTKKIADYQHSHHEDSKSEFFGQVVFNGDEVGKIESEVKKICNEQSEGIIAPVDQELSKLVLAKLIEKGGVSNTMYLELVGNKVISIDDLLQTGLLDANSKKNLLSSI